jgi:hypothetical protein
MSRHLTRAVPRLQELLVDQTHPLFKHGRVHAGSGRDPDYGRVVRKQDWHEGVKGSVQQARRLRYEPSNNSIAI